MDPQIPTTETYSKYRFETPLRIFTRDNKLIGEFGDRRTIPIAFEDTPKAYIDALLNTEDKRFFEHRGVDVISLANDVVGLFLSDVRTGASTITMQLAKIISFSPEQTFIRKFKEMLLAVKIEHALTKEQILELYINIAPLGKHAYGVQAGAHTYYGKPVSELNLAQIAMLAAVSKRPEAGNPINGPEYAIRRRNLVLRRMLDQASISRAEYEEAVAAPITAVVHRRELDLVAPFPAEWVRQQLVERYGTDIYAGYEAVTTLDSELQLAAQRALRTGLEAYDRRHGYRGAEGRVAVPREFALPNWGAPSLPEAPLIPAADGEQAGAAGQRGEEGTEEVLPAPQDVTPDFEGSAAFRAFVTSALGDRLRVQGKEPAVVLALATRRMMVARADATILVLPWEGLRWARRYLGVDAMTARPQTAADVAEIGDVVYIEQDDGGWRLAQVPDIAGALVALDTHDGAVRALVGGYDFVGNQFDHALQARRQPGSGFKPFVYSAALENGVTPASVFLDAPLVFRDQSTGRTYRPRNDSGRYNGPTRLREALYRSINLVSIRVMLRIGADNILRHAGRFGFPTGTFPDNTQLAIGGGTMGVTPLEMATAYAAIANGGYAVQPHIIERVRTIDGDTVFEPPHTAACDPCTASEQGGPVASAPRHFGTKRLHHGFHAPRRGASRHGSSGIGAGTLGHRRQDGHHGRGGGYLVQRLPPKARRHRLGRLLPGAAARRPRIRLHHATRHLGGLHAPGTGGRTRGAAHCPRRRGARPRRRCHRPSRQPRQPQSHVRVLPRRQRPTNQGRQPHQHRHGDGEARGHFLGRLCSMLPTR